MTARLRTRQAPHRSGSRRERARAGAARQSTSGAASRESQRAARRPRSRRRHPARPNIESLRDRDRHPRSPGRFPPSPSRAWRRPTQFRTASELEDETCGAASAETTCAADPPRPRTVSAVRAAKYTRPSPTRPQLVGRTPSKRTDASFLCGVPDFGDIRPLLTLGIRLRLATHRRGADRRNGPPRRGDYAGSTTTTATCGTTWADVSLVLRLYQLASDAMVKVD